KATAKLNSLVFILSLPVTRFGPPTAPLLFLDRHANRCGEAGQPGRRAKGCGLCALRTDRNGSLSRLRLAKAAGFRPPLGQASRTGSAVSESSIVAETAARIFADLADPQEINRAKDDA